MESLPKFKVLSRAIHPCGCSRARKVSQNNCKNQGNQ
nr:MAG TPA: Alpha-A conotoxin PIVA-like protein [Caudoviricetes sp.]